MPNKKIGVLVDAFSSGTKLPARFHEHGFRLIHVQSQPNIPEYDRVGFDSAAYEHCLLYNDDLDALSTYLEQYSPEFVIAGGEYGVLLTDHLNASLGLPGNTPSLSACRRDKFKMAQRLAKQGVPAALSFEAKTLQGALDAARQIGSWPVVLKPKDSASSEGIHFCHSEFDLAKAFHAEIGKRNDMNAVNTSLLIMEYLEGQQYTVQSTTYHGKHFISEIWLDQRHPVEGHGAVYDIERLLPAHGAAQDSIRAYAIIVLDALGVKHGPGYLEIMMTDRGPILIEATSRLMGCQDHAAVASVKGTDALSLCVSCYADPDVYKAQTAAPYELTQELAIVSSINQSSGVVTDPEWETDIFELPSFLRFLRKPALGDALSPTVDLLTNYAVIYLSDPQWNIIKTDYNHLRNLDARPGGMFRLGSPCEAGT